MFAQPAWAPAEEQQQTDAQAQQLLQKHRSFVGWQLNDGTFASMRVTGSATNKKGEKVEDTLMLSRGIIFHQTETFKKVGNMTYHTGFTGNLFWTSYENGFTMPLYGESAKALASLTMLMQEGTSGLPGTFKGNKTIDGKSVALVRVTMLNGDPIDLYIDPATGAYVKAVIDPDGPFEEAYRVLSYADVAPGKKMIGSYRIGDDDDETYANTKFEPNVDISNEDLHPPAATASWTFASDQPVPIRLTADRILVDVKVNGVKGTFILDTGADSIYLDDRFADRAKIAVLPGTVDVGSVYGTTNDRLRKADFDFGNATLHDAYAYSEDFTKFTDYHGLDGAGYAGVIGADLFAGAIVKLNIYDSNMTILDPATDLSSEKGLPVFVDLSGAKLTVPMTLDKTTQVNAVLDTGNPGSILFGDALVAKNWKFNPRLLTLGPIEYNIGSWIPCCVSANYALLGYDFLKHFDFVFDYPHGRMFLSPNKN
jgi:hypothetical protein